MPIVIDGAWIEEIRAALPEAADHKFVRMTRDLGLSEYDSKIITGSKNLSDIFDKTTAYFNKPKEVVNWIIVELLSIAKGDNKGEDDISIDHKNFAKLVELVDGKVINRNVGKKLLVKVLEEGIDPEAYVKEHSLGMVSDAGLIEKAIDQVLAENPKSVDEYKAGNQKVTGFFVGKIMRQLGGKADPSAVNSLLIKRLEPVFKD
jgi:aspartyl-tRNA(Asn)/glutamyl-tRNA(Gln) amidotransferase subunit B